MIHIAFAEDQLLFRKGMMTLLGTFKNMQVTIEASHGEELLNAMAQSVTPVDVALIDINMPVMNGIETLRRMRHLYPATRNIILTVHEEDKFIHKLIEEGANAYLAKNAQPAELEKAITAVVAHDYYFNENTMRVMRNYKPARTKGGSLHSIDLTNREQEVLLHICREHTSPEIAERLFISESTVNGHRNNLLAKTGARNTAGLVLFAIRNGLLDPDFR